MRHGYGELEFLDGSKYNGHWEMNFQTYGTYTWADGSEYSGFFKGHLL